MIVKPLMNYEHASPRGILLWHKILLLLCGTILALTGGLSYIFYRSLNQASEDIRTKGEAILSDQTKSFMEQIVRAHASLLDAELAQIRTAVSYAAEFLSQDSNQIDDALLDDFLPDLLEKNANGSMVYFADLQGRLYVHSNMPYKAHIPKGFRLIDEPFFPFIPGNLIQRDYVRWSHLHLAPFSIRHELCIDAVAPVITNSGVLLGFIGISVFLDQVVDRANQNQSIPGAYVFLVDSSFQLVGAPPNGRVDLLPPSLHGAKGAVDLRGITELENVLERIVQGRISVESVLIGGYAKYVAYHPLNSVDWRLGVVIPISMITAATQEMTRVIDNETRENVWKMIGWAAGLLSTFMILGVMLGRSISYPLREMAGLARRFAGGNFSCRLEVSGTDEINHLASTFNYMADHIGAFVLKLEQMNLRLRQEVEERRKTEEELRSAEEKYRDIFEGALEGIFQIDPEGRFISANPSMARILGYDSPREMVSGAASLFKDFLADEESAAELWRLLYEHGSVECFEVQCFKKDGSARWIAMTARSVPGKDGIVCYYEGLVADISDRKQSEAITARLNDELRQQYLERKFLSKQLIELLEADRKRIAMDLHDGLGQTLTGIKMVLENTLIELEKDGHSLVSEICNAKDKTVVAIKSIKCLAHNLRPSAFDHLGLLPAIQNLVAQYNLGGKVNIKFFYKNIPSHLSCEIKTVVFRVTQEALHNAIKHAAPQNIHINLSCRDNVIYLSIEDDGSGFDVEAAYCNAEINKSLGLLIMRERLIQVGGYFSIESEIGVGTIIIAEIPIYL